MSLDEDMKNSRLILYVVDSANYNARLIDVLKSLGEEYPIVYITLNKTAFSLDNFLKENSINLKDLIIVDCITRTIRDIEDRDNIIYIDSPKSLSDLSFILSGILSKRKGGYVILDSITTLLVYHEKPVVARFILNITNKIRDSNYRSVFFAVDVDEHRDFLKEIGIFVDKVVKG